MVISRFQKVLGTNNVADAMTKAADRWALDMNMKRNELHFECQVARTKHLALSSLAHLHKGLVFISTEVRFEDPAHASASKRVARSPVAVTRMKQ